MTTFFTVGHSQRTAAELVGLLQGAGAKLVADVRAFPRSRSNPQFNIEALPETLAASGIGYEHLPALGGRRGPVAGHSPNDFWQNASFRNYADYAATATFRSGLERLRSLGREQTCAIMCAEALWWRCHRRIIADYLMAEGDAVFHILAPGNITPARVTAAAERTAKDVLIYRK